MNSGLVKYFNLARYLEGVFFFGVFLVCGSQKVLRSGDMLICIYIYANDSRRKVIDYVNASF